MLIPLPPDPMPEIRCPNCDKTVRENQNSIFCDACNFWLHLKCSGLNKIEFDLLSENHDTDWFGKNVLRIYFLFKILITKNFKWKLKPLVQNPLTFGIQL